MRKTISKKTRQEVYKKYGGLCAYCGCTLPENGFRKTFGKIMFLDKENKECFSVYGLVGRS